jgi:hypothetical protein
MIQAPKPSNPAGRQKWHIGIISALLLAAVFTITLSQTDIIGLLASSASSTLEAPARVYFVPERPRQLLVGDTMNVDLRVTAKVPINAFGARVLFPSDIIEVIGISKEKSFLDLWTEDTEIDEKAHAVRFSGGSTRPDGVEGEETALTIKIKAINPGRGAFVLSDVLVYPNDGSGISMEHDEEPLVVETRPQGTAGGSSAIATTGNPDLNLDGKVTLVDISILAFKMLGPYDIRYDLDGNGKLGLSDLSILFTKRE